MTGSYEWPYVLNLGNTMLGVPMLAMPYCMQQCGCILGTLLIFIAGYLSVESSIFLLRTAEITTVYSYERTAEFLYGRIGKSFIASCIIAFIFGIAVASFVIIGDIIPDIINTHFPATENSVLFREEVIAFIAIFIIFPLCLIRQIERLVPFSIFSLFTYALLIFYLFTEAFYFNSKSIFSSKVKFFDLSGVLICMPIIMTGFSCQAQVLIYLEAFPETMKGVPEVKPLVRRAILLVCMIYTTVGLFGYFTFISNDTMETDLFHNLSTNFFHQILRLAFCVSVIISFPMVIFPMRSCIYSLCSRGQIGTDIFIPKCEFGYISLVIIIASMTVAVLVPDIGIILNITGGYAGAFLSFICPAMMFIKKSPKDDHIRGARIICIIGILSLLSSPTLIFFEKYRIDTDNTILGNLDANLPVKILAYQQEAIKNVTDIENDRKDDLNFMREGRDLFSFGENNTDVLKKENRISNRTIKELDLDDILIQDERHQKSNKTIKELDLNDTTEFIGNLKKSKKNNKLRPTKKQSLKQRGNSRESEAPIKEDNHGRKDGQIPEKEIKQET